MLNVLVLLRLCLKELLPAVAAVPGVCLSPAENFKILLKLSLLSFFVGFSRRLSNFSFLFQSFLYYTVKR